MVMLHRSNASCQVAFMMIVNIAERRDAMAGLLFFQTGGFQLLSYQVAHCFGTIGIATCVYKRIELIGKLIIK